ncbi:sensor histidine kinase [Streptomyces sp. NPDC088725]|uniref:sensor histidine kinase n=1 Tax=Streptomyces sp. NPDC088725 TaxID=3365873 RepID=UPI003812605F
MRRPRLPGWTATLTWKAAVFITVMCCMLAALLGTLVHVLVTRQTVASARAAALSRLDDVTDAYKAGRPLPRFSGIDPPGMPRTLRTLATDGERGTKVARFQHRTIMWAAGPADGKALAARVDYSLSESTIANLDRSILASSALAIGVTLLVGAFAVTRITRRLHLTAQVARRISAGDLDARVNDPRTKDPSRLQDEVSAVSGALDTMVSTLQGKLLREQRFTADVAHELRTPLTGLSAAAELLPEGRPAEMVRERVRTMRALTEDLLEISRLDTRTEKVELTVHALAPMVEGAVRASGMGATGMTGSTGTARTPGTPEEEATPETAEVRVVVVRDGYVETDRRRLERVLGNLLANARKHGRPPIVLTVEGTEVTVSDHGDGYPAYLLEHGPQRFRTESGGRGHGLGLTIALGQSAAIGAVLTFGNDPAGGAVARLALPPAPAPEAPTADHPR